MAKAKLGATYAQIINNRCHWIFTATELPEWCDSDFDVVDITGLSQVAVGDVWDGASFIRVPPPAPPPPQFSSLEFLDLFTPAEQIALAQAAMANAQAKLWYDRVLAANFITLADPRTEAGLASMATMGLLTAARVEAIIGAMR